MESASGRVIETNGAALRIAEAAKAYAKMMAGKARFRIVLTMD